MAHVGGRRGRPHGGKKGRCLAGNGREGKGGQLQPRPHAVWMRVDMSVQHCSAGHRHTQQVAGARTCAVRNIRGYRWWQKAAIKKCRVRGQVRDVGGVGTNIMRIGRTPM